MTALKFLLIIIYIVLAISNFLCFKNNRTAAIITILTVILSTFMLFSSNTANADRSEVELDMSGYRTLYEQYDVLEHPDFKMYPIFYSSMYLGQNLGLDFRSWWAVMSVFAMSVILIACRIHHYSTNLFLAAFMSFYEMIFFSGFKFFYGFCFLLLAYGFLLRNTRQSNLLFALFTCLAGGFHAMYFFFLILLIKPFRKPKYFVTAVVLVTVMFTVLMRLSESAASYLSFFFDTLDNEHINKYTVVEVHSGFFIALFIHVVTVYVAYRIRHFNIQSGMHHQTSDTFFYTVLLSLVIVPFYSVALTFMRIITAFSLVVLTSSSSILNYSKESRAYCTRMALLLVLSCYFVRLVMGFQGFFQTSMVPYFDVL